jgi:hypothetical protein
MPAAYKMVGLHYIAILRSRYYKRATCSHSEGQNSLKPAARDELRLARAGSKTQPGKESRSANSGAKSPGQLWRGALIVIIGSYPGCPCRTSRGSDIPKQSPGPRVEFRRLAMLIAGPISECPVIRPNTLRKTRSHTSTYIREPIILPLARVRPPPSSRPPILHHPAADIRARASSIESGGSH